MHRTPRVLIVEADDRAYDTYSDFLAERGFAVEGAGRAHEAIAAARRQPPDFIVLGPPVDQQEVTEQLSTEPSTRSLPVVTCHPGRLEQLVHQLRGLLASLRGGELG